MDFVVRTHEVVYSLQDFGTFRNGSFVRDNAKMNKGQVGSSLRKKDTSSSSSSSSSLLSSATRQVTSVSSSLETPSYTSRKVIRADRRAGNGHDSSDGKSHLWNLVVKERKLDAALAYLEMIISQDEIPDKNACGRLIAKLCRAGRTRKAVHVLELLNRYGVTGFHIRTYSVLAKSLCDSGEVDNALKLLRRMQSEEGCVNPDVYMYTIVMNAVFRKGRFEQGMKLLDEMRINGVEPDSITCHTVVNAMCKQGRLDEAIKLVTTSGSSSHGLIPCTESYNAILNILCSADRLVDAAKLLADMCDRRGYSPSAITFRILIRTLCSKSLAYRAITLLESMPEFGCKPDVYHYNPIIACLCRERKMEMVIECLEVMISRGCYPHIVIFNTLLAGLCLHGSADAAVELFNELRASRYCTANLGSYNIMIEGLSRLGRASQALKLLDEARCFRGFKLSKCAVLIVGLISERDIDNAMRILDELKRSRVVVSTYCYNWIIKALCNAGETDRAIDLLVYMVSNGHSLAYASYAAVVEGLASVGLVKEGQELVNELSLRGVVDKGFANGLATKIEKMDRFD